MFCSANNKVVWEVNSKKMCIFLGNDAHRKGYRFYDPQAHKPNMSQHIAFLEMIPFFL